MEQKKQKFEKKREAIKIELNNKSSRGSIEAKVDLGSSLNYISVKDSKVVSILSTAASVEPLVPVSRYSKKDKRKIEIEFPQAFAVYNLNMGGVDLHDQHCSDLKIHVKGKKWTHAVFNRIIESSLSNAFIIWKVCKNEDETKQVGVKHFALEIADEYLLPNIKELQRHKFIRSNNRRLCTSCGIKVATYCLGCQINYCLRCFTVQHNVIIHSSTSHIRNLACAQEQCRKRTTTFCEECNEHICPGCFGKYHDSKKLKFI